MYVHTTGNVLSDNDYHIIGPFVTKYLYSLINGLSQKNFGFNTVDKCSKTIKTFYSMLNKPKDKLYIDSGGYSIIAGQVPPENVYKLIECYNYFLNKYQDDYDYIFSLDIPIFLKYLKSNSMSNIYDCNKKSLTDSKYVLDNNPILYDKFIFVWQFKLMKQFRIWNHLYKQLFENENKLKHFALGGMVGLRGITNIKFSPFVVPIFKLLKLVKDKNLNETSQLHMFGVYGRHDRFIIAFLNKLFNDVYLKDSNCKVNITYDTINYTLSGLYNVRKLELLDSNILVTRNNPFELIDRNDLTKYEKIKLLVEDKQIYELIVNDIKNIKNNNNLDNPPLLATFNIIQNHIIDTIYEKTIDEFDMVEMFCDDKYFSKFKNNIYPILIYLESKYPLAYKGIINNILENFRWAISMSVYWRQNINHAQWDLCIKRFVGDGTLNDTEKEENAINFPFDLEGELNI